MAYHSQRAAAGSSERAWQNPFADLHGVRARRRSMIPRPVYDPFPKYLQIREVLLRWLAGRSIGEMLPTEKALAQEFQVSRVTIREALKSLIEDGIIARRAGLGTWLARAAPDVPDRRVTGPIEDFVRMGFETHATLLSSALVPTSPEIAAHFRQKEGRAILEIQRLRIVEGVPFLLLKAYFPPAIGKKVANTSHSNTLYVPTLRARHDPGIREEWQRIEAVACDHDVATKLEVGTGIPTLVVKRLFVDSGQKPIAYFVTIYRADRYYYSVKLPQSKLSRSPPNAQKRKPPRTAVARKRVTLPSASTLRK